MQSLFNKMISTYYIGVDPNLIGHILELKNNHAGLSQQNSSAVGGWHSQRTSNIEPWFDDQIKCILHHLQEKYILRMYWFNINSNGNYNKWHTHSPKEIVAVYYISTPEGSGNIEFRSKTEEKLYSINPKAGQVIIFPGSLEHRVEENLSEELRISAGINLKKK